jgi:hypothetical protein
MAITPSAVLVSRKKATLVNVAPSRASIVKPMSSSVEPGFRAKSYGLSDALV